MQDHTVRKIVRIGQDLGRVLRWVLSAKSKDPDRPVMTQLRVEERNGPFGQGAVLASDGFRIHVATNINYEAPEGEEGMPWEYKDHLDLEPGVYDPYARVEPRDHLNELWEGAGKYPQADAIVCYPNPKVKPVINLAINPKFLREAVMNADPGQAVYIRIYQTEEQIERGDISVTSPVEIISQDKNLEDVVRLAIVMPMHLGYIDRGPDKQANKGLCKNFPVAWTGSFPKEKKKKKEGEA